MQIIQTPNRCCVFTFPKTLSPILSRPQLNQLIHRPSPARLSFNVGCYASDEFPVDETFLEKFGPKEKETEDEARRSNWIERGWAPWEEILTPEADFARKSLNEGEEVQLQSPEAIEAFRMLNPNYRTKKIAEMGLTEDEWYKKQFQIKGDIPEKLSTLWAGPVVMRQVPPRDWPPPGWEVDQEELKFIREAHVMMAERVDVQDLESKVTRDTDNMALERYNMFLRQYEEWVEANKDRLEEESYKVTYFLMFCAFLPFRTLTRRGITFLIFMKITWFVIECSLLMAVAAIKFWSV